MNHSENRFESDPELRMLMQRFLRGLPERAKSIQEALEKKEWERVAQLAHTLKGSAASFNQSAISQLADKIELLANANSSDPEIYTAISNLQTLVMPMNEQDDEKHFKVLSNLVSSLSKELADVKEKAEVTSHFKEKFIAFLSHEIRTPLASISGYSELMYDSRQSTKGKFECIAKIRKNAKELERFLETLIKLSQTELGTIELRSERFVLSDELSETFSSLKALCLKNRIGLILVPTKFPTISILSDPSRLREILLNTVLAVIEETPKGSVIIELICTPDDICFTIDSTSNNIPTGEVNQLFEPGATADCFWDSTMKGKIELCLRFSQRFVKALGGKMIVEKSTVGLGSRLRLQFPRGPNFDFSDCVEEKTPLSETPKPKFDTVNGLPNLSGCHVLVFEDEPDISLLISHFLKKCGAQVTIANNGKRGVESVKENLPDIILMDIQMPGLNGFEATEQIRKLGIKVPIIGLTAHAVSGVREKCMATGFTAFLTKPFDGTTLLNLVHYYRLHE